MKLYKKYPCTYCNKRYPVDNGRYIYINRFKLALFWLLSKEMKVVCKHCGGVAYTKPYIMIPFHFKHSEDEYKNVKFDYP